MNSSRTSSPKGRIVTFFLVALIHAGLILGPLWMGDLFVKRKPKENMFRVKIGGRELSQGPVTGMPQRVPPRPAPPPEPRLPEPQLPKAAEPRIPVVKPKPKPKPKPTPKPKPKPRPTPKPKLKPTPKPNPRPKVVKPQRKTVEPKVPVSKKVQPVRPRKTPPKVKPRRVRDPLDDVYRDPNPPNLNPAVPIGPRNTAQKYAPKADNKAPGGGRTVDDAAWERYGRNVERYIYSRWAEPPRSLLGSAYPETVIAITVEANGRVSSAKIVKSSGNRSMEASVQALLANLDLLPRPPEGRTEFRITLKTR